MADLPETESYDEGVYQLELTDSVVGGVNGKANASARNLSNRTKWLKARVDELKAETSMSDHEVDADPHTGYATKVGVQHNAYNYAVAGGTGDEITVTYSPAYSAWVDGMSFFVKITAANTIAAPTVSPDGLTAKTIVKNTGIELAIGEQQVGMIAEYKYNLTLDKVLLQNPNPLFSHYRLLLMLDYPTIQNATNILTVTPSTDAAGGKVAIAAGTLIELGKAINNDYGVMRQAITSAFTSPSLSVSSTYYLRAKFIGESFTVYVQKGTDTDSTPAGLVGTVNGTTGGGFDSTHLDILLAKVVTSTAGTTPTVTALKNKKLLYATGQRSDGPSTSFTSTLNIVLNWGRTPNAWNADTSDITCSTITSIGANRVVTLSRYTTVMSASYTGTGVTVVFRAHVEAK